MSGEGSSARSYYQQHEDINPSLSLAYTDPSLCQQSRLQGSDLQQPLQTLQSVTELECNHVATWDRVLRAASREMTTATLNPLAGIELS